jgi:hypothetical protein
LHSIDDGLERTSTPLEVNEGQGLTHGLTATAVVTQTTHSRPAAIADVRFIDCLIVLTFTALSSSFPFIPFLCVLQLLCVGKRG